MRIQILSDFHIEFFEDYPRHLEVECQRIAEACRNVDALVIAGDLGAPFLNNTQPTTTGWDHMPSFTDFQGLYKKVLEYFCSRYDQVFLVAGNHEFYGTNIEDGLKWLESIRFENFLLLDGLGFFNIADGVKIIGSTLWFGAKDFNVDYWKGMSDSKYNSTTLESLEELGLQSARKIATEMEIIAKYHSSDKVIVVSHMAPTNRSVPKQFRGSNLSRFYVNELVFPAIERMQRDKPLLKVPDVWIHGHTHSSFDYCMPFGTRIVCNPFGYYATKDWNQNFDYKKIIEI